jgi:hypothetical protein
MTFSRNSDFTAGGICRGKLVMVDWNKNMMLEHLLS